MTISSLLRICIWPTHTFTEMYPCCTWQNTEDNLHDFSLIISFWYSMNQLWVEWFPILIIPSRLKVTSIKAEGDNVFSHSDFLAKINYYLGILVCEFGFIPVSKSLNLLTLFRGERLRTPYSGGLGKFTHPY